MISFKQFIIEQYYAPLYHAIKPFDTSDWKDGYISELEILESINKLGIRSKTEHTITTPEGDYGDYGVSTTRNLSFAKKWSRNGLVLELDQNKIRNHFKIMPFSYYGGRIAPEHEEFITSTKGKPITSQYIKAIHIGNDFRTFVLSKKNKALFERASSALSKYKIINY